MRFDPTTALAATAIGVLAGMRTMSAPATVSVRFARDGVRRDGPAALRALAAPLTARGLAAAAFGELVIDKLPFTPDRTEPLGLALRTLSGAACGAALATWRRESPVLGALLGGAAAVAAAYGFLALRKAAKRAGISYIASGVAEDALVATGFVVAQKMLR